MGKLEEIEANQEKLFTLLDGLLGTVETIWKLQEEYVPASKAAKMTGVCTKTLSNHAKLPNTVLKYKLEGNRLVYEVKSIIQYNNKKAGININPERIREQFKQARQHY